MNILMRVAVSICVIVILYSLVEAFTVKTKNAVYIKNIMMLLLVMITVKFVSDFDFNADYLDFPDFQAESESVWENSSQYIEKELENAMHDFLSTNGLDVDSIDVKVKTDYSEFFVEKVILTGADSETAKNLISGHFQIGIAYIFTE